MKPILHLNLIRKWFDMIGNEKTEEYREITTYWSRVFTNGHIKIKGKCYHPTDVNVRFSNGYAKERPQKTFEIKFLTVGLGKYEWGADPGKQYFILTIGKRINP